MPAPSSPARSIATASDVYRVYFHGPAYRVVEQAWWDGDRMTAKFARNLPANHHPPELPTIFSPRQIELCFQTAGLWELSREGQLGLPQHVDQVRVLRAPEVTEGSLYCVAAPSRPLQFDIEVLDTAGKVYVQVRGYRTVALPKGADANALQALHALVPLQTAAA